MIPTLKTAVENNKQHLQAHILRDNNNDHSAIKAFQEAVVQEMNTVTNSSDWDKEIVLIEGQKDRIDILGRDAKDYEWVIEIDTQRADQVAKKALSRIAVKSANKKPFNYVAILYPRKEYNNINECIKYLRYAKLFCETLKKQVTIHAIVIFYSEPENSSKYEVTYYKIDSDLVNSSESNSRVKYKLTFKDKNGVHATSPKFGMNKALMHTIQTLILLDTALAKVFYDRITSEFSRSIISSDEHVGETWFEPIIGTNWLAHTGMWKTTDKSFKTLKDLVKEIGEPYSMEIVKC